MGNCINKDNQDPVNIPTKKTKQEILREEINAYITLELLDITPDFKSRYSHIIIKNKIIQQYCWMKYKKKDNIDMYIPEKEWNLRYVWKN